MKSPCGNSDVTVHMLFMHMVHVCHVFLAQAVPRCNDHLAKFVQVIVDDLPVALANVDCDGNETSLLQCSSSQSDIRSCRNFDSNFTDSTVLACSRTDPGARPLRLPILSCGCINCIWS